MSFFFFPVCRSRIQIASSDGWFCIFIFIRKWNALPPALPPICRALQAGAITRNVCMHADHSLLEEFLNSLPAKPSSLPAGWPSSLGTGRHGTADAAATVPGRAASLSHVPGASPSSSFLSERGAIHLNENKASLWYLYCNK